MKRSIPSRPRAPATLVIGAAIVLVIGGATHGWATLVDIVPIPVILVGAFYVLSGRDSDTGALVRHQLDERQEHERLKVQALVGRVLSVAVAVAYIAASAARTALWPWAILLGLMAISFIVGRLIYGEHLTSRHGSDKTT
jgi:4-hydroxybenzoate polyprenyltransferase